MSSLVEQLRESLAPHYEVERELASGGMGTVFLARDPNLDRPVAIKILRPELASETASERFLREARILARLSHPNVVPVFQAGQAGGLSYYVMEYVEGETLRERLERGAIPKEQALKLADDVLSALEEAHKHGIVHRDVKPDNIFLVGDRALLGDFGIAKRTGESATGLTGPGRGVGTPDYMPPEQIAGAATPRTDLYAVGMVLYEALTGRKWSIADTTTEVDWSGVPPELLPVLRRALAWSPEERWQDAASFRNALARPQQSAGKRRLVIAAAVSVAALVLAAGWFLSKGIFESSARKAIEDRSAGEAGSVGSGLPTLVRKQVTFTGQARSPAIAPDGKSVAFLSDSAGFKRLMVQAIDGGEPLELLRAGDLLAPRWSRDGSEILVAGANLNLDPSTQAGIYAVPRLGGEPRFVLRAVYPTESPGGSRIAYAGVVSTAFWIRDLASGDRTRVPLSGDTLWFRDVRWSPAGDLIAVSTRAMDHHYKTIWTITADGTHENKVVEDTVDLSSPRWSPQGDALYYNRAGQLWRIDIDLTSGEPSRPGPGEWTGTEIEGDFSISGDGSRLVYAEVAGGSNVWVADVTGSAEEPARARPLTRGTSTKSGPRISPDGRTVAFYDMAAQGILTVPLEGGTARLISKPVAGPYLAWSPDGRSIAFVSKKDRAFAVSMVAAIGGPPRRFDGSQTHPRANLAWCSEILYQRPGNRNFQIRDPETGDERPLVSNDSVGWMFNPKCSPDGTRVAVYWNRPPNQDLWIVSLADGSQKLLLPKGDIVEPLGWSSDGRWVYARVENSAEILRVPATGGPAETVAALPFEPSLIDFGDVHFDGEHLVVNVGEPLADIWLLENFDRAKQ